MAKDNQITELEQRLKANLTETAYDLIIPDIAQNIKNINDVFAINFPTRAIELFNVAKTSYKNDELKKLLFPLDELAKKCPSVTIAKNSGERLNCLANGNIIGLNKTYSLDRITSLETDPAKPGYEQTDSICLDLKQLTLLKIDENIAKLEPKERTHVGSIATTSKSTGGRGR